MQSDTSSIHPKQEVVLLSYLVRWSLATGTRRTCTDIRIYIPTLPSDTYTDIVYPILVHVIPMLELALAPIVVAYENGSWYWHEY